MKRKKKAGLKSQRKKDRDGLSSTLDEGIAEIRETWEKFERGELHGSYGKRELLQSIYSVYCNFRGGGQTERIWRRLARCLPSELVDPSAHILDLLINVALPHVQPNVVTIWEHAIRYGEAKHIRPFMLRRFFYVKGGLVRCARLFQEEQQKKQAEEEAAAMDEEDRQAEIKKARRAKRRRAKWSMPIGMRTLY